MIDEQPLPLPHGAGGLLTRPTAGPLQPVALLLLNAGGLNRAGPFRLHAVLARRLAALGFATLRLDQPGVGDAVAPADRPLPELIAENLDALQAATGCHSFVVGGICSAADLGWRLARVDHRVSGVLMLDPLARRGGFWFRLGQLQMLLGRGPGGWWELLRRRLRRSEPHTGARTDDELRDWAQPGEEAVQLAELTARGVELFMLYTGGAARYLTHPRQFFADFGRAARDPRVQYTHWPQCDHLFYRPQDRERLIDSLARWMQSRFGASG